MAIYHAREVSGFKSCFIVTVAVIIILGVVLAVSPIDARNVITEDKALARFKELAGTEDVVIIRHSNNSFLFGDIYDVTFELEVDGVAVSGRCTASLWSEMVCRMYMY